jgi:hypothetical protein
MLPRLASRLGLCTALLLSPLCQGFSRVHVPTTMSSVGHVSHVGRGRACGPGSAGRNGCVLCDSSRGQQPPRPTPRPPWIGRRTCVVMSSKAPGAPETDRRRSDYDQGRMELLCKAGPDGVSLGDCPFCHFVQLVLRHKVGGPIRVLLLACTDHAIGAFRPPRAGSAVPPGAPCAGRQAGVAARGVRGQDAVPRARRGGAWLKVWVVMAKFSLLWVRGPRAACVW